MLHARRITGIFDMMMFQKCILYMITLSYTSAVVHPSCSRTTDTTKTFTGESSLAGAIVQTRAATTGILFGKKNTLLIYWKATSCIFGGEMYSNSCSFKNVLSYLNDQEDKRWLIL